MIFAGPTLVALVVSGVWAASLSAQSRLVRTMEFTGQVSFVPMAATNTEYLGVGPTIRVGFRPSAKATQLLTEIYYTHTFSDDRSGQPAFNMYGVMGSAIFRPVTSKGVNGLIGVGLGAVTVDAVERGECNPPLCFRESGGNYQDASLMALATDLGIFLPLGPVMSRWDVRVHFPISGTERTDDSGKVRVEFAAGISLRR